MEENILEGVVETPQQKQIVFLDDDFESAYGKAVDWLSVFRPIQCQLVQGKTQEGLDAVQIIYVR